MNENKGLIISIYVIVVLILMFMILVFAGVTPLDVRDEWRNVIGYEANINYNNVSQVIMTREVAGIFNSRFKSDSLEFVYCMHGEITEDAFIINEIVETKVLTAGEMTLSFISCINSKSYLGSIHSHPNGFDALSSRDIYTFGKTKDVITGIIYGKDSFNIYTQANLKEPMKVTIQ